MSHLCDSVIDPMALLEAGRDHSCGAEILFTGTVRNQHDGRPVAGMSYTAYRPLAEKELAAICQEAEEKFEIHRCQILHRLGELTLGELSVAIAVHAAHRAPAYEASRYAIEELKRRVPIFKQEHYCDGQDRYLDGATLDQAL